MSFMISVFRALLFNHMVESHSFNVGQADNLGKINVPLTTLSFYDFKKNKMISNNALKIRFQIML